MEPGYIAPGMKSRLSIGEEPPYDELRRQYPGLAKVLSGDPLEPAYVAGLIADAVAMEAPPLRWRIGEDAETFIKARCELDDEAYESNMRSRLGLSW
jgi:hypothetical protein